MIVRNVKLSFIVLGLLSLTLGNASSSFADPLPDTKPLTEEGDLAAKMVAGMHTYLDRELAASVERRKVRWEVNPTSMEAYGKSVKPNRKRLRQLLGTVETRLPPKVEYVGGPDAPALVAETPVYKVYAVRWAVLPGVDGEGLLLEPTLRGGDLNPHGTLHGNVVAVPDAGVTPEAFCGLAPGVPPQLQFGRLLVEHGLRVLVPVLIDRAETWSNNPKLGRATNQPHREFIQRMAYEMGRTLLGYEVQKILAGVDWFLARNPKDAVGLFGDGIGGRVVFYAGALDDRVRCTAVIRAFGPRERIYDEPLDANVWSLLTEFGDAEIAAYLYPRIEQEWPDGRKYPRRLIIGETERTKYPGPVPSKGGWSGAAPGTLSSPGKADVDREYNRFGELARELKEKAPGTVHWGALFYEFNAQPNMNEVISQFVNPLEIQNHKPTPTEPKDARTSFDPTPRQKRQFDQLVAYTQKLWRDSELVRKNFWSKADASSPAAWEKSCEWYRDYFHTEVIGKLPDPTVPLNPRTRQVYDEKTWTGYEVMLDVCPDVFAYGILLLPKDLKPGEKRPVVVCQHGLEGTPRSTIVEEKNPVYDHFSKRLVELGYIVYAPQNPYYGENVFRQVQRKANPLKLSLFSFIIRQHQRTLDWLETLPNVDPKRMAFYGLSYGGKTAMRVPAVEKRYCLSICSGDFNEWIGKNVSVDLDRSYMWTREYEMYEFDLGNTFNYAEMAYLIAPRPFMVERGHDDGVGTDEMVSYEFAKVRYLYDNRLKIGDRTTIEYYSGGHRIFSQGTFEFLKKNLRFPVDFFPKPGGS